MNLRDDFQSLRADVERNVPEFSATIHAALRRGSVKDWRTIWRVRVAVLATVLVIAAGFGIFLRYEKGRQASRESQAIAMPLETWTSPTALLLETPGRELLRATPRIESTTFYSEGKLP